MAINITVPQCGRAGFILNATSADLSGCEELQAAPGAGLSIILEHITISSGAAITVTIGQGKTGAGVTKALLGPISFAAGQTIQWDFPRDTIGGLALDAATALTVDASGAGDVCIFAWGRIQ
jgi:hypothetical protein